ncbi:hypothetical protein B0H16DRAFT_1574265 [Mycena metata]|uniref:Uncharacterized protein n=1 Tax=Mycena metata TaxID=1033252 RepID=A0AAD7MX42_9AGAR|nr:hypothetical protein B0H16DRAFT_1574265 [Mycena metata]
MKTQRMRPNARIRAVRGNGGLLANSFPRSLRVHPSPPVPSSPSYPYPLSPSFPASRPPPHNAVRALESRLHGRQRGLILRLACTTTTTTSALVHFLPHAGAVCVHPPSLPFLLVVPIPIHTACTRRSLQSNLISQTTLPCAILQGSLTYMPSAPCAGSTF